MTGLFTQYVLVDQVTGQKWALEVFGGELYWAVTGSPSNGDMILQDGSVYWDFGMSNGIPVWTPSTKSSSGDLVYFIDSATGLDYQLSIVGGELYWAVAIPQLGGSSGPINPYDYINIFTEEEFERKVVVKGDKAYLVGIELGFEGSKSFYDRTTLKVSGSKRVNFKESKVCRGSKLFKVSERKTVKGNKSVGESLRIKFQGSKIWSINETRKVEGKKDILAILEVLDLI